MLLADLHIHSNFSDGRLSIPQLVDLYGQQGFDVIAITDHLCDRSSFLGLAANYLGKTLTAQNFSEYQEVLAEQIERARRMYNMVVLPGIEYTKNSLFNSRSAHILGIGVTQMIDPLLDAYDLANEVKNQNGLTVAAHPVWTRKLEPQTFHLCDRRQEVAQVFDAWEVASGTCFFDEVANSGLPMLANSDLHHPRQIRSWKTLLECKKNTPDILNSIRQQKIKFTFFEGLDVSRISNNLGESLLLSYI